MEKDAELEQLDIEPPWPEPPRPEPPNPETPKRRNAAPALFGIVLALTALFFMLAPVGKALAKAFGEPPRKAEELKVDQRPRIVVAQIQPVGINDTIRLPGAVEPWLRVSVAAESGGRLEKLAVREGQSIGETDLKQPIALVDESIVRAQLQTAEVDHGLAKATFERAEELHRKGVASKEEFDQAQRNLDFARSQIELVKVQLAHCSVHAPFAGIADRVPVEEGDFLDRGQPICELIDVSRVKVVVSVPEMDVPFLKVGDQTWINVEALDRNLTGKIIHVSMLSDDRTRTFPVKIEVANPGLDIRPGMIARVTMIRRKLPDAVAIPMFCVVPLVSRMVVFVEKDGIVREREVKVGVLDGQLIQITSGIGPGDRVVVVGQRQVQDAQEVKVVQELKPEDYMRELESRGAAGMRFPGTLMDNLEKLIEQ
ncbi:MAG TPA: efflux RND transporter periplasmic adaptor subunit [Candidatus Brocadiia bacterium]|nr:efflux RND transporter periplasmic adaptor subunit [Candidatus Brocadiia bacterium]